MAPGFRIHWLLATATACALTASVLDEGLPALITQLQAEKAPF